MTPLDECRLKTTLLISVIKLNVLQRNTVYTYVKFTSIKNSFTLPPLLIQVR